MNSRRLMFWSDGNPNILRPASDFVTPAIPA
jgi:hypothetical protein